MGVLDSMIDALLGRSSQQAAPSTDYTPAPPLPVYPTPAAASEAKRYGFGYGSSYEPYLKGEVSRVRGGPGFGSTPYYVAQKAQPASASNFKQFIPESAEGESLTDATSPDERQNKNLDLTNPNYKDIKSNLNDTYVRAALAANRIPISGLGFDPRRMNADVAIKNPSVFGAYSPRTDSIYFNTDREGVADLNSTPLHEATHRGLKILRDTNPEAKAMLDKMPNEEYLVRWLMASQGGDPENYARGNTQREMAVNLFGKGHWDSEIKKLNDMAAQEVAKRHPRGPN